MPSPPPTDTSSPPDPPPVPVETHPYRTSFSSALSPSRLPDPTRLAPEDAYFAPMVRSRTDAPYDESHSLAVLNGGAASAFGGGAARKDLRKVGGGPGGRRKRRKGAWKKLLWVRQSCMFCFFFFFFHIFHFLIYTCVAVPRYALWFPLCDLVEMGGR